MKLIFFILGQLLMHRTVYSWKIPSHAVCEHSHLTISCPENYKIKITYANYGRLIPSSVFCPYSSSHDDRRDCISSNSKSIVQGQCDGRGTCTVAASNSVFGDPCVNTYKYLEIEYDCIGNPVDGSWSVWNSWTGCSKSCGTGHKSRTRSCDSPAPANGGSGCSGNGTHIVSCLQQDCPINGGWSGWNSWSGCSKSCGIGHRSRTRSCDSPAPASGGAECDGLRNQTETCSPLSCPTQLPPIRQLRMIQQEMMTIP